MSDDTHNVFEPEIIDDDQIAPIAPEDVASAARSCQAIILILLFLVLVACAVVSVAVLS